MLELFDAIKNAKDARETLEREYGRARNKMALAQAIDGAVSIRSAAFSRTDTPDIDVETHNIMGIEVPRITTSYGQDTASARSGYSVASTSSRIDEASESYGILLKKIIVAAEYETIIKRILTEIEKTKRRVNALEYKVIPQLTESQKLIQSRLDERERESLFVVKRIKKKIE